MSSGGAGPAGGAVFPSEQIDGWPVQNISPGAMYMTRIRIWPTGHKLEPFVHMTLPWSSGLFKLQAGKIAHLHPGQESAPPPVAAVAPSAPFPLLRGLTWMAEPPTAWSVVTEASAGTPLSPLVTPYLFRAAAVEGDATATVRLRMARSVHQDRTRQFIVTRHSRGQHPVRSIGRWVSPCRANRVRRKVHNSQRRYRDYPSPGRR